MPPLKFSSEVLQAKNNLKPIVAVETTILSHGLPTPHNIETAHNIYDVIIEQGAIPAFIGIMEGEIHIGLSKKELEFFGTHPDILKVNRSNLSYCLTTKAYGSTTVSTTMRCAQMADIPVMATGGIGGVHRDVLESFDISSDLRTFTDTKIAVICSGVKSILDIAKTLEFLETEAIPICGYKTSNFPSFYTRDLDYPLEQNFQTLDSLVNNIHQHFELDHSGILIANPIPKDFALCPIMLESWIDQALMMQKEQDISGRKTTPFLLEKIHNISQGKTLKANQQLIISNAKLAAHIARLLAEKNKTNL